VSKCDLEGSERLRRLTQFQILYRPAAGDGKIKAFASGLSNALRRERGDRFTQQ
jgi:hypothetical protein